MILSIRELAIIGKINKLFYFIQVYQKETVAQKPQCIVSLVTKNLLHATGRRLTFGVLI